MFLAALADRRFLHTESVWYDRGIQSQTDGNYEQAIEEFRVVSSYSDAAEKIGECEESIKICDYSAAVALKEAGSYEEAITVFTALGEYSDSADQIESCNELLREKQYNNANALMENGDYENAYIIFFDLGDYKDSEYKTFTIRKKQIQTAEVGEIVKFGRYEQDNRYNNGKEEIEWRVLAKEGAVLLISEKVLDYVHYNNVRESVSWEKSSLRKWLNETFLYEVFSDRELDLIVSTNTSFDENNIEDMVYVLKSEEVGEYFDGFAARKCGATKYAEAQGVNITDTGTCYWWLRTKGKSNNVKTMDTNGKFCDGIYVDSRSIGVRPALWVNLEP